MKIKALGVRKNEFPAKDQQNVKRAQQTQFLCNTLVILKICMFFEEKQMILPSFPDTTFFGKELQMEKQIFVDKSDFRKV